MIELSSNIFQEDKCWPYPRNSKNFLELVASLSCTAGSLSCVDFDSSYDQAEGFTIRLAAFTLAAGACTGITGRHIITMAGEIAGISGLIANPGKIWLAVEPRDMRRGIDGLSMVVQQSFYKITRSNSNGDW